MTVSLKHAFESAKSDGADSTLVQPSNWNAEHTLTMATGKLLGRTTAATGAVEEITVGTGLTLSAGELTADALGVSDGDKGDIVVSSSGTVWSIDSGVLSTFGRTLVDDADAGAARTTLGLGTAATSATTDFAPAAGSSSITTLGTVATGTWNATAIGAAYGGTGQTSYTAGDLPYASGTTTISKLGIGSSNTLLTSSGTAPQWSSASTVTGLLSAFVGDSGSGGTKGLVPAPTTGDATKYLKGDGTWGSVSASPGGSTTEVQYNSSGSFAGDSTYTFNATTKRLTANSFGLAGNISAAAWTTSGIRFANASVTLTDTSSSGTVATAYTNVYGGNTIAASSSTTYTDYATTYIAGPTAGTNVAITNPYALALGAPMKVSGGTVTTSQPVLNLSQTWNASGTTFEGVVIDVTRTAAGNNSTSFTVKNAGANVLSVYPVYPAVYVNNNYKMYWTDAAGPSIGGNRRVVISASTSSGDGGVLLGTDAFFGWANSADAGGGSRDLYLRRRGAANLTFGAADAAAPVAQTLSVQSVVAGTSNTAGANFTIAGSQGTGTGAGGSIIFQVAPAGSSGTSQNGLATFATMAPAGTGGALTLAGGTVTTSSPVLDLSQTWNDAAVTFTGLKLNVTSTASAAASLLMDLQAGGSSVVSARKDGLLTVAGLLVSGTFAGDGNWFSGTALNVRSTGQIAINTDTILTRRGAANFRFGLADVAAPVAQTLSVQSVVAGTSNTAGANFTMTGSQGTGTGAGGSLIFQVAPAAGSTGTSQNALATALTIDSTKTTTFAGPMRLQGYTVATLPAAGTAGRVAYVTDATAPTYLGALTGGGAVVCQVFDNGTAWVSG